MRDPSPFIPVRAASSRGADMVIEYFALVVRTLKEGLLLNCVLLGPLTGAQSHAAFDFLLSCHSYARSMR